MSGQLHPCYLNTMAHKEKLNIPMTTEILMWKEQMSRGQRTTRTNDYYLEGRISLSMTQTFLLISIK